MATEIDPYEYRHIDQAGEEQLVLPPELPFDEATCSTPDCGVPIGYCLDEWEDTYGAERSGVCWSSTYIHEGRYICEDCANNLERKAS